jgi:hypothetical protein
MSRFHSLEFLTVMLVHLLLVLSKLEMVSMSPTGGNEVGGEMFQVKCLMKSCNR